MSESRIYVDGTNQWLRTLQQTTTAGVGEVEVVSITDPTDPTKVVEIATGDLPADVGGMVVRIGGGGQSHGEPLLTAPVCIGGYASELPPNEVQDGDAVHGWLSRTGEQYTTNVQQELNVFSAYGKTLSADGTTWVCFIDLSDTTNWPHQQTGRIDVCSISAQVDKSSNATGSVSMGVITRIDGTSADVTLFSGLTFTNTSDDHLEFFRNYYPGQLKLAVAAGKVTTMATTAVLTNVTDLNTATPVESHLGAGTVTLAVGDAVVRFVKSAGTSIVAAMQTMYHSEP